MDIGLQNRIKKIQSDLPEKLPSVDSLIRLMNDCIDQSPDRATIHSFLRLAHHQSISKIISDSGLIENWLSTIINMSISSNYNVGVMLKQRSEEYGDKACFNIIRGNDLDVTTYNDLWKNIVSIAKSISILNKPDKPPKIGILSYNQEKSALVDLACLSFGFTVIPIPLNATIEHLSFILDQSEITHLFIGGKTGIKLWNKINKHHSIKLISLNESNKIEGDVLMWNDFIDKQHSVKNFDIDQRLSFISMEETQSIMYTSGTTSEPKGITFNQVNIISKRFARALALPEFGNDDIFLCYLPLFHTFGRYFELLGSLFWGATYSFAESPAFNSLLKDFSIVKPSIFISIPKRWVQLYELIEQELDLNISDNNIIQKKLETLTGGNLKWGLSAAGYLDPDIFSFFQSNNINVLSGYGMTEATGGITMTPPNDYVKDSVGKSLPGIELKIEKDGELCLRGPYVTDHYYKDSNSEDFLNGWFHTGDIFEERDGHYFIVDRKKDIYKNSRGQTIAPQKIENFFQDFDTVKSVFLVGDGKEFNTVLIYPDLECISKKSNKDIYDLLSSMILSVNSFLSPFERIVNFEILDRDFSLDKGELTPKGSFNRKNVIKNFSHIIEPMYQKNYISIFSGSKEIRIPNWLIRELGTVRTNLNWNGEKIFIKGQKEELNLSWTEDKIFIGEFPYIISSDIFDMESFIRSPALWLGNMSFSKFTGNKIFKLKDPEPYTLLTINQSILDIKFSDIDSYQDTDSILISLHYSIRKYLIGQFESFSLLRKIVDNHPVDMTKIILDTCLTYRMHQKIDFRLRLIETLMPIISGDFLVDLLYKNFLVHRESSSAEFSFDITRANDDHYNAFIKYLKSNYDYISNTDSKQLEFIQIILLLISDYGALHPTRFLLARSELTLWQISDVSKPLLSTAEKASYNLSKSFRSWIGKSDSLTVDRESGDEYSWNEVVTFDKNVRRTHRESLMQAIKNTSLIRESIFLFSSNIIIGLNDIPQKGIWITQLGKNNKKIVFRVLVRTRSMGTHNLVINLNQDLEREFIEDEVKWLIIMGSGLEDKPLVENFGGYWPEHQLYTEEYIQGETVTTYLERKKDDINDSSKLDRWQMRWLHFIWNGIQAYQEFWNRTNLKLAIQPPSPANLIIPKHDYTTGTRLISISERKPAKSISSHFISLFTEYISQTEKDFPGLKHMSSWEVIFTATLQAVKVKKGKEILYKLKDELKIRNIRKKFELLGCNIKRIETFLEDIENYGVLTKPVIFASLRYERWLDLNNNATLKARASILQELYNDYALDSLLDEYPETRVRFFMMTCFKNENPELLIEFQKIIHELRQKKLSPWNLQERITSIQSTLTLNDDEQFFLARMLFPHVDSADYVELVTTTHGEDERLNLVIQTEGKDGQVYRIRPPFLPKEIAQFHSLLSESLLSGTFTGKHDFLLIFNARNRLIGGLYWKSMDKKRVHLEWVIIQKEYRNYFLSKRLMDDFYKRMRHNNIEIITVGFYVEKFFYKHGFEIDKQYGGLVKKL